MSNLGKAVVFGGLLVITACGPAARPAGHGDDDDTNQPDASDPNATCTPVAEVCNDGIDNDCNGQTDCADPACSGIDGCPVCGTVDNPMAQPLALPDGVDSGATCSTDANCASTPATPNCIIAGDMPNGGAEDYEKGCHASYVDTLNFVGFPQGATLTDTSKLLKVCATMEHSWIRDLNIELIAPNGTKIQLLAWQNRTDAIELFLGHPNEDDETGPPIPGVGFKYCWVPTGGLGHMYRNSGQAGTAAPSVAWSDDMGSHQTLPAGDYTTDTPFTALQGVPLNGKWEFRVTDLWEIDNGFLFDWSIVFDPSLVADCSGPIIE